MTDRGAVLITGGAGFLGTNIAAALAERGNTVLILDNLSRAHVEHNLTWLKSSYPDQIEACLGDVRDRDLVPAMVAGCRAVVHLAAQVAVTTSIEDPLEDFEVNARGTLNVLDAVRRNAPEAPVLFASTNKVYGNLLGFDGLSCDGMRYSPKDAEVRRGFAENTPLCFCSPYGCSKGAADQYVLDYARVYGVNSTVFRMSCLYGPHQYGHEDQGWVAHFLISALCGQPITIFGNGAQVRDVLHVDDAVSPYLLALDRPELFAGRAFNLGGGPQNTLSLLELIVKIEEITGLDVQTRFAVWRPGDQAWYVSDTTSLEQIAGWRARVPVDEGLLRLVDWLRDRLPVTPERARLSA